MKRTVLEKLHAWKGKKGRKPLLLYGARQVGKTYLLKEFGERYFKNVVYLNFESNREAHSYFENGFDSDRILRNLSLRGHGLIPEESLFIFDEIQECPNALTALKYFQEQRPHIPIVAAGSLLGLFLAKSSFPVGKVDLLSLCPMTFEEFLEAAEEKQILESLNSFVIGKSILSNTEHQYLFERFKQYLIVGGLPESVSHYIKGREKEVESLSQSRELQRKLVIHYQADIAKHSGKINSMHIERTWQNSAVQLSREQDSSSRKFVFKDVIPGIKGYDRLSGPIDWLLKAGLILKIPICHHAALPLKAFTKESVFKIFIFDVGILGAMIDLPLESILAYDFGSYKGYLAESFVAQEFVAQGLEPRSWNEGTSEIEFLLQNGNRIVPVEVKAGLSSKAKSYSVFRQRYEPAISVKLIGKPIEKIQHSGGTIALPIYMAGYLKQILGRFA